MRSALLKLSTLGLALTSLAIAQADVPDSGFFAGVGGSYNSMKASEALSGIGISNVYDDTGLLVASGTAGGPASPLDLSQSTFAPLIQTGYFSHFTNSNMLWGVKFFYQYLNATPSSNATVPQTGEFTPRNGDPNQFTGYVTIGSVQTKITHEFALIPFIGRSFQNSYIYLGAGPAFFRTTTNLNDGIGYAQIGTSLDDLTGQPVSFSNPRWVWGGAAELGMTYFLNPTFFLDLNYTLAITQNYTINDSGLFTSSFVTNGHSYSSAGTFYMSDSQHEIIQSIMLSINKAF